MLNAKVHFYERHRSNLFVVILEQDAQSVVLHRRVGPDAGDKIEATSSEDHLVLPGIGTVCTLAELYENTRFDPRSYPKPSGSG